MINFDKDIETITPFLRRYHFRVAETYKDFVKYESEHTEISVGYDDRDHYYFTLIGNKIDNSISLDVINLRDVFAYDVEIFIKKPFVTFFIDFFSTKGQNILNGDLTKFKELKKNREERAERYTKELIEKQNLKAADNAWSVNNYSDFIRYLDLVNRSNLPKSYELKYSIAKDKLSN
jgi:hypothetical protein